MHRLAGREAQRGQAIVLIAAMMTVLLGFVALALDSARAFETRRLLQDSVDAAALYAADSYAGGASWSTSVSNGANLFAQDARLYSSVSCPVSTTPTAGASTAVTVSCTGPAPATLTAYISDEGPAGQQFTYRAQYPMTVAIMQVLGINPNVNVIAQGTAVTGDQAWSPALATLSSAGCSGSPYALTVTGSNPVQIYGNLFTNGGSSVDASSALQIAGNYNTGCSSATGTPTYECWPSTPPTISAPACSGGMVQGAGQPTGRFVDPAYPSPVDSSLTTQTWPNASPYGVVVQPGKYATAVNVTTLGSGNANPCYFLSAGIYEFQAGLTLSSGIVSNRISPPDPRLRKSSLDSYPLWLDGSKQEANCVGNVSIVGGTCSGTGCAIAETGTWDFEVTTYRYDTYGGVSYYRESAAGACHSIYVDGTSTQALQFVISNSPGAQGYNIYGYRASTSNSNGCSPNSAPPPSGSFGFVANAPINAANVAAAGNSCPGGLGAPNYCQSNQTTSGCPSTGIPANANCSLGLIAATVGGGNITSTWAVNNSAPRSTPTSISPGAPEPDEMQTPYESGNLPNQDAARGNPAAAYGVGADGWGDVWGDLANSNFCVTSSSTGGLQCPSGWASGYITPGGVQLYFTNNTCLTQNNGDAYLFGGYQYNWLTVYEPAATTCTNTLGGSYFSSLPGAIYTPGAVLKITTSKAMLTGEVGGIVTGTATISSSGSLTIPYNRGYAPPPPGDRLTG